jgi:hypothetical protein
VSETPTNFKDPTSFAISAMLFTLVVVPSIASTSSESSRTALAGFATEIA